jgi:hypothetical protein
MGGGLMGFIRFHYCEKITNKQKITSCFSTDKNHISMMCYTLLKNKDHLDKSHFIHTIEEIYNSVNSTENKEEKIN